MSTAIDPRIVKTRHNLRQALIELMQTTKIENISIQNLTNQAGVTRGTFYLHYQDKGDFINQAMHDILTDLFDQALVTVSTQSVLQSDLPATQQVEAFSLRRALIHIETLPTVFETLLIRQTEQDVTARLTALMTEKMQEFYQTFRDYLTASEVPAEVQIAYAVSAVIGSILEWLRADLKYTPRYLTKCIRQLQPVSKPGTVTLFDFFVD